MKTTLRLLTYFYFLNGVLMLILPSIWYEYTPGVAHSGVMNVHFIRDIGLAFCAVSAGLLIQRIRYISAILFIGGHAVLHFIEFIGGHMSMNEMLRDAALIIAPALVFCGILLQQKSVKHA